MGEIAETSIEANEVEVPIPRQEAPNLSQVDFEPLHNWALVKEVDSAVKVGSLIIPEAYGQTFRRGIVWAVGPGTTYTGGGHSSLVPASIKVGDLVAYGKAAGLALNLDEGTFLLVRENECFGKIPKAKAKPSLA